MSEDFETVLGWLQPPISRQTIEVMTDYFGRIKSIWQSGSDEERQRTCDVLREIISRLSLQEIMDRALSPGEMEEILTYATFLSGISQLPEICDLILKSEFFWTQALAMVELFKSSNHPAGLMVIDRICAIIEKSVFSAKASSFKYVMESELLPLMMDYCEICTDEDFREMVQERFSWIVFYMITKSKRANVSAMIGYFESLGVTEKRYILSEESLACLEVDHAIKLIQKKEESERKMMKSVTMLKVCFLCKKRETEKEKLKVCSRCKSVYYCGRDCQRRDWSEHKPECKRYRNKTLTEDPGLD